MFEYYVNITVTIYKCCIYLRFETRLFFVLCTQYFSTVSHRVFSNHFSQRFDSAMHCYVEKVSDLIS